MSDAIFNYLVDMQEWGLHILFNNIDISLKYHLHTGIMRDQYVLNKSNFNILHTLHWAD